MQNNTTFSNREALQSMLPLGATDTFSNKIALDEITGPPLSSEVVRFLSATQAAELQGKTDNNGNAFNAVLDMYSRYFISLGQTSSSYPWILDLQQGNFAKLCWVCQDGPPPVDFIEPFYKLGDNDTFSNSYSISRAIPEVYPYCFGAG